MTPAQAAEYIGCSPQWIRAMIKKRALRAKKVRTRNNQHGYEYDITKAEADRVKDGPARATRGQSRA